VQNTATFQSYCVSGRVCGGIRRRQGGVKQDVFHRRRKRIQTAQQRSALAVRKLILTASGLVCLAGVSYFIGTASGQPAKGAAEEVVHKVGLIDMGHIFNEYAKLKILREEYTVEMQDSETRAKGMVTKIQALQAELKEYKEGTAEFSEREQKFAKLTSDFDTFRKVTQKDLLRKEAKMYHTVYLEVQDAVEKLCRHHGYTLVLRFNKEDLNTTDPQKLIQGLNRQVVYHRNRDDMTSVVLKMLNQQYEKANPAAAAATAPKRGSVKQVSGESEE
jgi:outer membrane protein